MTRTLRAEPLTPEAFAPFGDVLAPGIGDSFPINGGACDRFHDRARIEVIGDGARLGVSLARSRPFPLPLALTLLERHPLGSQAFVPMSEDPWLVVVAPDEGDRPGRPRAFVATGAGVNYLRGTWHGVLTPLARTASFVILDRIGPGDNLQEFTLLEPWTVEAA